MVLSTDIATDITRTKELRFTNISAIIYAEFEHCGTMYCAKNCRYRLIRIKGRFRGLVCENELTVHLQCEVYHSGNSLRYVPEKLHYHYYSYDLYYLPHHVRNAFVDISNRACQGNNKARLSGLM